MGNENSWADWAQFSGGRGLLVITPFSFVDDRFRGFGLAEGQNLPFLIYFEGRPYNTHIIVWGVIPGKRSLRLVKNRRSFIRGVDQNFSSVFHWAIYKSGIEIRRNLLHFRAQVPPLFDLITPLLGLFPSLEGSFAKRVDCPVKIGGKFWSIYRFGGLKVEGTRSCSYHCKCPTE